MPIFRNPRIQSINGQPVSINGTIMVPNAQSLNALFVEFKNQLNPPYQAPSDWEQVDKLAKAFGVWCSSAKGYTVVLNEDVFV